ncbi:DUF938 domain-containing protein [Psychrobacter aestuarii]|uniref:tRNA (guanine(46)-N(7))-methyltransferase n=1 Tax=Psychrobacter aestuarii TaxID=556327 RepID=A0ABP3FGG3_9GAMM|nr:DUF938 domain-containing protein [Psychrobacter aestuarii]
MSSSALSHRNTRAFRPEMLKAPRDFFVPEIVHQQNASNLALEIGAGKGKHALGFAPAHPDTHLIAIERTRTKFEAFDKLASKEALPNLTPIHADAIAWSVHALPPASLQHIYLLYPNPEAHNPNQQWLNMPFFEFLLSRLQSGGKITLATNIESYMDNAEQQATILWCLPSMRYKVPQNSARTHFEIKYLARGETCWELVMQKPEGYQTRFDTWQSNKIA